MTIRGAAALMAVEYRNCPAARWAAPRCGRRTCPARRIAHDPGSRPPRRGRPYDCGVQRLAAPTVDRRALMHLAALAGGFAFAFAVAYVMVHPIAASPVGYDTAGSVLYFERLIHGQVLEQPYGATPKPAMTVLDGLLFAVYGWSAISLAAVAAFAAVVTLGAELARRVAGPAAAVFAFVALLGSRPLLLDASTAYAVSWAALWLIVAGFAITAERPRYFAVGLALCMATLTRLESIVVVGGALTAVAAWRWLRPRFGLRPAPRGAWLVGLGFLAVPVMLVHDWLLIRDPFYWASVSATYSAGDPASVRTPVQLSIWLAGHYGAMALLVILACAGAALLLRRRQWAVATGLALLGPGIGLFLLVLAARGTYVSARYVYLVDVAVTFAAAVGFSAVRVPELAGQWRRHARLVTAAALFGSAAVAVGAAVPYGPLDAATRRSVFDQRIVSANLRVVEPLLRRELQASGESNGAPPRIVAPVLWTPLIIVDFKLRIPEVGVPHFTADGNAYAPWLLRAGQLIYHDRTGDPKNGAAAALESEGPATMGAFTLTRIASDPAAGWWLYRVSAQP